MSKSHVEGLVFATVALLLPIAVWAAQTAPKPQVTPKFEATAPVEVKPEPSKVTPVNYPQKAWLGALEWCESKGNPKAVNPKDRDNTPSYGLLQFKPGTFYGYAKRYGIPVTDYMNPAEQEAVVMAMIQHRDEINWYQQFPACTRRLGLPPA